MNSRKQFRLEPKKDERLFLQQQVAEAFAVLGIQAAGSIVGEVKQDMNNDLLVSLEKPIPINFVFEKAPKAKLEKMGWFMEDEDMPYLAYFVPLAGDGETELLITEGMVVDVPTDLEGLEVRRLQVTQVKADSLNRIYYNVKLIPYRPRAVKEISGNDSTTGFSFAKGKEVSGG